jgi:pimeloyl-ACP methyl ester carboxylesterase
MERRRLSTDTSATVSGRGAQRFETGAGAIAWDSFGEGPPVVLVHGTPWSSWTWRRLAPDLASRFTVYVFDLLGFGAPEPAISFRKTRPASSPRMLAEHLRARST